MNNEQITHTMDAWKTTIDVQKHFNDIELKIRNLAVTVLVALLGAAAIAIREGARIELVWFETSLATVLVGAGLIAWLAFWFMDGAWYHPLLKGAVGHSESIEAALTDDVVGIGLSKSITTASPWMRLHSRGKMAVFYSVVGLIVVVTGIVAHFSDGAKDEFVVVTAPDGTSACGRVTDGWVVFGLGEAAVQLAEGTTFIEVSRCD